MESNVESIVHNGGVDALVAALTKYPTNKDIVE